MSSRPFQRHPIAVAVAASLLATLHLPATAATLSGRVTAADGSVGFEGATVRVLGENRQAVSGDDGSFRIGGLAAGQYTLEFSYVGAAPVQSVVEVIEPGIAMGDVALGAAATAARLDSLLVVGQTAGQAAALSQQRAADNLVSIVSADAIGQFPDQNVAESLQRLPGVSLERDQGEGRFVVLRGLDASLNSTSINGVRVPGPEDDSRAVNLDVVSSDLLETLEVVKTVTPDMDGDAVGGHIEIKSLTAFDRSGRSIGGRVEASHNQRRDSTNPKLAATVTDRFGAEDDLGVAASVSWYERDFASDGIETASADFLEAPDGSEIKGIAEGEQRDYMITRERLSANLNFDWRPGMDDEFYWRNLYSRFRDDEVQSTNVFTFDDGDTVALGEDGGRFAGATVDKLTEARIQTQDIFATTLGGRAFRGRWTIDYSAAYSLAETEETDSYGAAWRQEGIDLGYDIGGGGKRPHFFALDPAAFEDAAAYALDEIVLEPYTTEETETALKLDLQRDFDIGDNVGSIKFGAKSRLRDKSADFDSTVFGGYGGDYSLADFARAGLDYPYAPFQPIADAGDLADFIDANRDEFEIDEEETAIERQGGDYRVDEDIHAAYAMATFDLGGLRLIGGVRAERTEFDAAGTRIEIDEENGSGDPVFAPVALGRSYTNWLPGLHARWEPRDGLVVRASANKTVSRPNFAYAAPYQVVEIEEDDGDFERNAELGNPELEPLRSTNVDLSVELYPGDVSMLSAALFYKDIADFIVLADVAGSGAFADFDEAIQPLNGDEASVRGLELAWTQKLAFLPAPFDGMLFSINHAWIDSESTLPSREGEFPLPRQSDRVGNVALGYENETVSLRLAGNYRSAYLDSLEELDDPAFDRYVDDHFQLDLSAKYRFSDAAQLYFNAINLNDRPLYAYLGQRRFNSQFESYGRTFELGLQVNF
ncbi:TonB-dependent receptor [Coralloluteibacterium stylophorae]|uniref:TonB-dependent receptor n=1 Tax=Coralloluteibacterium stylophorae TaxID=1776034 RepID=A0A8J8AZN2_9GAMM|nr:TonB-dependent receptor [Coralloluteibacterium stylophorae]MBS7456383.1 TonB-dependent receptor [Coralloluteibacterium stylophorae]